LTLICADPHLLRLQTTIKAFGYILDVVIDTFRGDAAKLT
jgi:hypothetical protein